MAERKTIERARRDKREGKSASTQAGEFVREEIDHIREGKHGARSAKQAIAIGLSKARRAGVKLPPPGPRAHAGAAAGPAEVIPGRSLQGSFSRDDEGPGARVAPRRIARALSYQAHAAPDVAEAASVVNGRALRVLAARSSRPQSSEIAARLRAISVPS